VSNEKEQELQEALSAARNEIARLSADMERQRQSAVSAAIAAAAAATALSEQPAGSSLAGQKAEVAEPAAAAAAIAAAPPQPPETAAPDQFENEPDAPLAGYPEVTGGLVNDFGNFCSSSDGSSVEFTIDPKLALVDYSHPSEIVALLYSSNSVSAVPDGGKTEKCKGYIVALKRAAGYSVYIAWHLVASGKVVVCVPDRQPADSAACTRVLLDAVSYFEIVGFMMELEHLGTSISSYNRVLKKIPVLRRITAP
jgi:hypothetical protein